MISRTTLEKNERGMILNEERGMREIKFRGKQISDFTDKSWRYGSLCITNWNKDKKKRYFIAKGLGNYTFEHEVIPESVGQFTGLKNKEEEEIYEGDILSGDFPDLVFFDENRGQWMLRNSENPDDTLWEIMKENNPGVMGNIHENPELLEQK